MALTSVSKNSELVHKEPSGDADYKSPYTQGHAILESDGCFSNNRYNLDVETILHSAVEICQERPLRKLYRAFQKLVSFPCTRMMEKPIKS
jgi:hypothetical protein